MTTSKEAYISIQPVLGDLQTKVLDIISKYKKGCISDQVLQFMSLKGYISSSSVTGRFSELERKGLIEYTGEKRKGRSKRNQRVMRAV
jgi:hypothetical protein